MTRVADDKPQDTGNSNTKEQIHKINEKIKGDPLEMNVNENGIDSVDTRSSSDSKEIIMTASAETEKGQENGAEKCEEEEKKEEDSAANDGTELLIITDTGFNVNIICPGMEPFQIPVSSMELVQEVYQVLMDREDTCHRTCFSLQLDGQALDNFTELKSIEGLKEGSELKVVEEPYTGREARLHVRHLRDLLKSIDQGDAYNGLECASLSFINVVTGGNILENKQKLESVDCTPPEYIIPGGKDRPLLPLHPVCKQQIAPPCLKVLTTSAWNPPDGRRKLHGDLIYLYVVTLEDKKYHISACTKGFFVNQSTNDVFNYKPADKRHLSHSLVDLLNHISPLFKRNFQQLLKIRAAKHPFERVNTPYQIYSWLAPIQEPTLDAMRAEDASRTRLGYEEHIPGHSRDWNEELQSTRELSRKTLPDRLLRERAVFKVHSDFVAAATRGTIAVIDGNIMAINPSEDAKMQMFLWNNIFFSLGFDVKDHYKDFGGDYSAYVAPGNDLQGVRAYSQVDADGVFTLGTVVLDYRGYRVTAQSIIPGILEREQEQSVVYGSIDFGKTVVKNEKYNELLQKSARSLRIKSHSVVNDQEEVLEISSSVECKGIIGNDNRYYILDLLRTFPPDPNFLPVEGEDYSEKVAALGYPRTLRHTLVTLRQEAIDHFVESKYSSFLRIAAHQFQLLKKKKIQEAQENKENKAPTEGESKEIVAKEQAQFDADEAKTIVEGLMTGDASKEIVRAACEAVGSQKTNEFELRFNPDVFQPHVKHNEPEGEVYKRDKQLVKDVAEFILMHQIPTFVQDCLEHSASPGDGFVLSEALHHSGINMRYLGTVTEMIVKFPSLSYLHSICISELICRSTKHLFKWYMQGVEMMSLSAAISHFLNCLFGSFTSPHTTVATDELHSQRAKKRNRKKNKFVSLGSDNNDWALETPKSLWKKIIEETQTYFAFKLDCDSLDIAVEKYDLYKVCLLRSFCKKVGCQLLLREYHMDSKTKQCFFEDDIVNMFPVVKNIHPRASDAYHVFTSGQSKIQQGLLREGYELISEALNLLNNVYGAMHPEIAACNRLLARLNYIMGDYGEALVYQQRAVMLSERVLGIDHPNTITEYAHMALYCFANNQIPTALQLMYRARYLSLLCHGENHPEVALYDSNIGLILQGVGEFDLALKFLQKALQLNIKYFGEKSLKVAMNYHLVARTNSCKGDFRTALQNEREAWDIYKLALGEQHEKTKDSGLLVKKLTEEAVKLQKAVNQIQKGETTQMPHIQMYTPSLPQVLESLNVINGIVFVHISQEDIEKFRQEMVKKQTVSELKDSQQSPAKKVELDGIDID